MRCIVIFAILLVGFSLASALAEPQTITYKPPTLSSAEPQTIAYKPPTLSKAEPQAIAYKSTQISTPVQTIAYNPTQIASPISELANMSFKLGIAYHQAQLCQNFTLYNFLVDQFNAWVRQYFGEGADALFMSMITANNLTEVAQPQATTESPVQKQQIVPNVSAFGYLTQNPFGSGSDLSKFGKQEVMSALPLGETISHMGAVTADRILWDFLREKPAPLESITSK